MMKNLIYLSFIIINIIVVGVTHVNAQFNRCAGVTDGIFLSDLVSCNGFYYCFDNTVVNHGYCPQGFYFVETTQSCDPSEIVNCDWACPSTGFIRKPVRISCSDYIECLSGIGTRKTCPGDLLFDPIIAECNTQTTCIANPCPTFNVPGAPIFIPHYQDCTRYFLCYDGAMEPMQCPNELHWNPTLNSCDHAASAGCQISF